MLSAIKLNDEHGFHTQEIDNIDADGDLSAKLEAAQAAVADLQPESLLDIGLVTAKPRGVWTDLAADGIHPPKVKEEDPHPTLSREGGRGLEKNVHKWAFTVRLLSPVKAKIRSDPEIIFLQPTLDGTPTAGSFAS